MLGRTVGTFTAAQTAGLTLAPLLGGLLSEVSWRLGFVVVTVKFAGVAIAPLVYVPLFEVDTRLPFLVAAGFSALLAVSVVPWFGRYR